jgi:glycosyltransferase involved in cell wall biosynthesis
VGRDLLVSRVRLAYVVAEYPKVSHTFVMREIDALRSLGETVETVSIRRTPAERLYSDADRAADASTYAVLPVEPAAIVRAHAYWALRHPRRYARALRRALALPARNPLWRLFYFVEAGMLAAELRRRGTQHVHAHFAGVAASVSLSTSALLGRPWSFTMHGPLEFDEVTEHALPEKVRDASFVACISDFCRAQLMRLVEPEHWPKLHVVHCGLEPERYRSGERSGPVEILTVGRLEPMKGFAVLLEAVAALGLDVRLTIVGDGLERAALEARARGLPVTFTGALGAPDVIERLAAADIFCLPSFAEGVPVVLMEAMAAGLPVVSTRIMGIPELVEDGRTGRLVAPGRAEPLTAALRELAADPARRRALGEAGRAKVRAEFDVRDSARALAAHFNEAAR